MNLKIEDLKNNIESIWKNKENISSSTTGKEREVIEEFKKLANKYFEHLILKEFSLFKTRISAG